MGDVTKGYIADEKQPRKVPKGRPWKKGQSGNPAGRVKTALFSVAMRELLAETDSNGVSNSEKLAKVTMKRALGGSPRHLELLTAYVEGRPKQALEVTGAITTQFQDVSTAALLLKLQELATLAAGDPLHPLQQPLLEQGTTDEVPCQEVDNRRTDGEIAT